MQTVSLICILIALAAMMYFGYKGVPIILVAPLCGLFVAITSGLDLVEAMGTTYLGGFGQWVGNYFFTLFTGAIFGCVMADAGAARSIGLAMSRIARKFKGHEQIAAVWCLPILAFVLSYGGISVFVCFFTVIAIAKELFEEMEIPWRMYGVNSLGVACIALTMAPGSPSVNNAIAGQILGTTPMAAPGLSLIAVALACVIGHIYISWELRTARKNGERFLPTGAEIVKSDLVKTDANFKEMSLLMALVPSIVLIVCLNVIGMKVYLASLVAIIVAYVLYWKRLSDKIGTAAQGASRAVTSACNVAIVVGFGTVVASAPGYQLIINALSRIPDSLGYFQVFIAVNLAAGVAGSSSGGLSIALNSLGDRFIHVLNLNPAAVHRIATISSGGLDSLPCNGTVLNELAMAKLKPSIGYRPMFVCTVITPMIVGAILCLLTSFIGVF
ncbi:MAG: hypothetical protein MR393_07900 [Intestinimonas massiliensis]|uniref:GntP family permease n=1 Tax=Intestinimonas TaxID=1392389 RepID=UPI002432A393|nr:MULTISPECIES: hypothetical protein [Intestinimonas]MCI5563045.1 hypothetical protein [Intestinimonas massiliensis (ex Afouda et al. 2020)]MDY5337970.1 hypothetical protein [Intestinimonas sp.]